MFPGTGTRFVAGVRCGNVRAGQHWRGVSASVIGPRMDGFVPVRDVVKPKLLPDAVTVLGNFAQQTFAKYPARRMLSAFRGKYPGIPRIR
jgi:hypothetical protein